MQACLVSIKGPVTHGGHPAGRAQAPAAPADWAGSRSDSAVGDRLPRRPSSPARFVATNIGNQTQGSLSSGIILGLLHGFVFTFVPLIVVWQAGYK